MKPTVKDPRLLQKKKFNDYKSDLSDSFAQLEESSNQSQGQDAHPILVRSEHTYKDGEAKPLFILGVNKVWEKHIKEQKWLKPAHEKETATGLVKLEPGKKVVLFEIQNGKLKATAVKNMAKKMPILKEYTWKQHNISGESQITEQGVTDTQESSSVLNAINTLAANFQQYQKNYQLLSNAITKATDPTEKQKAALQRKKVMALLQKACKDWEALTIDETVQTEAIYTTTLAYYERWKKAFEKSEEAQSQESPTSEKELYNTLLGDFDSFGNAVANLSNPATIEQSIGQLAKKIKQWEKMGSKSLTNELQAMKERYQSMLQEWKALKPAIEEWNKHHQQIETIKAKGEEPSDELLGKLSESNSRIQTV
jgi:hypothetical protein